MTNCVARIDIPIDFELSVHFVQVNKLIVFRNLMPTYSMWIMILSGTTGSTTYNKSTLLATRYR